MAVRTTTAEALVEEVFLFGRALKNAVTTGDESSPLPQALTGVLAILATEGECRQTDLANRLCVSQSALSRQIADLVDLGYIDRTPDPDDKRASRVCVSAEGQQKLAVIWDRRARRLREMLSEWSETEALAALDSIRKLNTTFNEDAHDAAHLKLIAR
ncbi:MarR family winged helix-turn-helix transcriptional regulator [Rhodococcoides kyotonense]|uniref:DNA-binding transcriptional regulator, MarR family n=1 Tax=Rhodococcoides kyotonense TaxID=398843 RepID=A0A239L7R1_9NOCA|nr:MarR family transcriptional regulator [Rhodococcus kyotonensis]SNT26491.1 DNA-binding transcriptional regulator, MarR family [Rhodococcus kyotonensis]